MNEWEWSHGIHADVREGGRETKRSEEGGKGVAKPAVETSWEEGSEATWIRGRGGSCDLRECSGGERRKDGNGGEGKEGECWKREESRREIERKRVGGEKREERRG